MQKYRKGTVLKTTANEPSPRPYILVERLIPFSADDAYYKAELRIVTSDTKRVSDYLKSLNIQDSFVFVPYRAGTVAIRILAPYDHFIIHRKIDSELSKLRMLFETEAYDQAVKRTEGITEMMPRPGTGKIPSLHDLGITLDALVKMGYEV